MGSWDRGGCRGRTPVLIRARADTADLRADTADPTPPGSAGVRPRCPHSAQGGPEPRQKQGWGPWCPLKRRRTLRRAAPWPHDLRWRLASPSARQGPGGPSRLQNGQGGAAPRLEGSIPSPRRFAGSPAEPGKNLPDLASADGPDESCLICGNYSARPQIKCGSGRLLLANLARDAGRAVPPATPSRPAGPPAAQAPASAPARRGPDPARRGSGPPLAARCPRLTADNRLAGASEIAELAGPDEAPAESVSAASR
jgi:hypothetical protein